jgi:hypothetical protein
MNTVERGILMPLGPALAGCFVGCLLSFASPERRPGATPPSLGSFIFYREATSTHTLATK